MSFGGERGEKSYFSIFGTNQFDNPLNEITLRKPFFLKLLEPSWFKTLVAVLLSIGMSSGINYLYKNYLKPIYDYKTQEKEKNQVIDSQKEKIQFWFFNIRKIKINTR